MDDNDQRTLDAFRRFFALPTRLSDEPIGDDEGGHHATFYGGAPLNSVASRCRRDAKAGRLADIDLAEAELRVVADEVKS